MPAKKTRRPRTRIPAQPVRFEYATESAGPTDSERIADLQKVVREQEKRIANLEARLAAE